LKRPANIDTLKLFFETTPSRDEEGEELEIEKAHVDF
jgi:hypothetical protein